MDKETLYFITAPNSSLESYINYLSSNEGQTMIKEYQNKFNGRDE